jgi:hypothetical protein
MEFMPEPFRLVALLPPSGEASTDSQEMRHNKKRFAERVNGYLQTDKSSPKISFCLNKRLDSTRRETLNSSEV